MFSFHSITRSALITVVALTSATTFANDGEKTITLQDDVTKAELVRLNISAGDVEVKGNTGNSITAVVTAVCQQENRDNCVQMLKELGWSKKSGAVTELSLIPATINRYEHVTVKVKLSVPKNKKLEINVSAGELRIDGTSACLTANLNAGQLNLHLQQTDIATAQLSAKVGSVRVTTPKDTIEGDRSLLVGADMTFKGVGLCHTKASVMAGEVHLTAD
ncbi:MAG: hypothetical protein EOO68_21395 [Moraxellaceae bacterium]|nr:MAG: hypothetical protein EOO68_21395 [Moraxellaceae bacterium]